MRYGVTDRVLRLALAMQGSRTGLSLGDIERDFSVGRRTAQRMRDAVQRLYPQTEQLFDDERRPRWRIPVPGAVTPGRVEADELADLDAAIQLLKRDNQGRRAASLEGLMHKIMASLQTNIARRIEPDLEALLEAEGLAMRPGPRPVIKPEVIDTIRLAIKQSRELYLHYRNLRSKRASGRRLEPYGFLFGNRHYLVGMSPNLHPGEARLFELSRIRGVKIGERPFTRDPAFSLHDFAKQSFGVYREPPHDVVWRFKPEAAEAAAEYRFHPDQVMEQADDGALIVRFRAGGLLEMCWHLYTWGDGVEVLAPKELKATMKQAHRHRNFRLAEQP
ncbi:MAG: helix-turn-helix transcriptional regulator [Alphaproteobacteria bacterium]